MNLYALRARTGASSGKSKMVKMMMEVGGWLVREGMVRDGALIVQVRGNMEKCSTDWSEAASQQCLEGKLPKTIFERLVL